MKKIVSILKAKKNRTFISKQDQITRPLFKFFAHSQPALTGVFIFF